MFLMRHAISEFSHRELQKLVKEAQNSGEDIPDHVIHTLSKIANSVKRSPTRVWNKDNALKLDHVGPYYVKVRGPALPYLPCRSGFRLRILNRARNHNCWHGYSSSRPCSTSIRHNPRRLRSWQPRMPHSRARGNHR